MKTLFALVFIGSVACSAIAADDIPEITVSPSIEVTATTPSCKIMRHRLSQEQKLVEELKDLVEKMKNLKLNRKIDKLSEDSVELLDRINSTVGYRSDQLVNVGLSWLVPPEYIKAPLTDNIIAISVPMLNWVSPWDQLPKELGFSFDPQSSKISLNFTLTPAEFCFGKELAEFEIGEGWNAPQFQMNSARVNLTSDLAALRESVFWFDDIQGEVR